MEYTQIGYFLKPTGIDGYIKVNVEDDYIDDFIDATHVFTLVRGDYVPFFIEKIEETHHLIVKFEDFDSPEGVGTLANNPIYLHSDQLLSNAGEFQSKVHQWVGYEIVSKDEDIMTSIGFINEMMKLPTQQNAILDYNDKEVHIPMVQSFILNIDDSKKQILMELPEGLLEL